MALIHCHLVSGKILLSIIRICEIWTNTLLKIPQYSGYESIFHRSKNNFQECLYLEAIAGAIAIVLVIAPIHTIFTV